MPGFTSQFQLGRKNIVSDDNALGQIAIFQDKDYTDLSRPKLFSCMEVRAILVKNDSGAAMVAGKGYTYKSLYLGTVIGALSGVNAICDGICDPFLTQTVAVGETCWLIIGGPTKALIGAGDQAANGVVQTLASGVFGTGTAGTNPIGHCGKAMAAGTSGNLCRVTFTNAFSAIK